MTLVVDASAVVAALVDRGPHGGWAEPLLAGNDLVAPHLMPTEVANMLRRVVLRGVVSADVAALAYGELFRLRVELFPCEPFAARVWELRSSVTAYDGWYVALAEALRAPLATLDHRLLAAVGPRCRFVTAPTPP